MQNLTNIRFFYFEQLRKIQIDSFDYSTISIFCYLKILKKKIIPKKYYFKKTKA